MDMWMKIASALLLVAMLVILFPHARHMLTNSPEAQPGDWRSFILPVVAVAGFVLLLMKLV
jgi:hypothetical protein